MSIRAFATSSVSWRFGEIVSGYLSFRIITSERKSFQFVLDPRKKIEIAPEIAKFLILYIFDFIGFFQKNIGIILV